jgi:hypothetical protein
MLLESREAPGTLFGSMGLFASSSLLGGLGAMDSLADSGSAAIIRTANMGADHGDGLHLAAQASQVDLPNGAQVQSLPHGSADMVAMQFVAGVPTDSSAILSLAASANVGAHGSAGHTFASSDAPGAIRFDTVSAPPDFFETIALRNFGGVRFHGGTGLHDGGAILNQAGNFGVTGYSPPNFLAFNSGAPMKDGGIPQLPEIINFPGEVNNFSMELGSSASIGATVFVIGQGHMGTETHSVTLQPALAAVQFTNPVRNITVSGSASILVIDNLSWT